MVDFKGCLAVVGLFLLPTFHTIFLLVNGNGILGLCGCVCMCVSVCVRLCENGWHVSRFWHIPYNFGPVSLATLGVVVLF